MSDLGSGGLKAFPSIVANIVGGIKLETLHPRHFRVCSGHTKVVSRLTDFGLRSEKSIIRSYLGHVCARAGARTVRLGQVTVWCEERCVEGAFSAGAAFRKSSPTRGESS